jgi:hypothetical protein
MRLLRGVVRLEEAAGAAAAAALEAVPVVSVVWSRQDERVDALRLNAGEHIAVDVLHYGEVEMPALCRERITGDACDLGRVYGRRGDCVGIVVGIDGGLLTLHLTE